MEHEDDLIVYKVLREQLAEQDLQLLFNQIIDITDDSIPLDEWKTRQAAMSYTATRIKENLIKGALAVRELNDLKATLKQDIVEEDKPKELR